MIKKPLKSNLIIDGEICRNIEQLKENFNLIDILKEFENGSLAEFCKKRAFNRVDEINEIDKSSDLKQIALKLCEIFDIEVNEALIEKEVEYYEFNKFHKKEDRTLEENEFIQTDEILEENRSEENNQTYSNSMKPSIKTIKIKNAGEILNSSFKFTPIKTNATSNIDLEDFAGNKVSSLAIKDGEIFNGLIIRDNFSNIEFESENLKKAYNIANDILLNFLDWKLKELNFQVPEDYKLSEAKFYYFALKNSLSLLEKHYSEIQEREDNNPQNVVRLNARRRLSTGNYYEERLNKVKEAIFAYEKVIKEPNNQVLWNNAISTLKSLKLVFSSATFPSGQEWNAAYYLDSSAKDSASRFFDAFIDNVDVVFKSSNSSSFSFSGNNINEVSGSSKCKNLALEEKINVIKAMQFKKEKLLTTSKCI